LDPIAHTLAGVTLAQTGLRKLTPLATPTLILAANLPDIDGVMSFFGSDASLYYRRGMTHGVLAQAILPWFLTAMVMVYDRFLRRRRNPTKEPVAPLQILLLSYIGVLSHPFLDWLNTYGVRLLMPFSGRWFYGDTLFIVDAWMWLLLGASAVFAYSQKRWSQLLWIALGVAMSWLITTADFVPVMAKVVWWMGLTVIAGVRIRGMPKNRNNLVALGCLAVLCIYVLALKAGNRRVHSKVEEWLATVHSEPLSRVMIGPLPANPFYREVLAVSDKHYYGLRVSVLDHDSIHERFKPVPIPKPDPIIERALSNSDIRGFVNWMRFPVYEVQERADGYRVIIRDLRYVRPDQDRSAGIGMAETFVQHTHGS
jgi:inner membrane protein